MTAGSKAFFGHLFVSGRIFADFSQRASRADQPETGAVAVLSHNTQKINIDGTSCMSGGRARGEKFPVRGVGL